MTVKIWVGTSGYSYPEWKGTFYPEDLAASGMLSYYSERFSTVEINNTFYRMPSDKVLAGWAGGTPDDFTFTLKAPRRITHDARLRDCAETLDTFCARAKTLGHKLGVLLFQLPPWLRKDLDVFDEFLGWMPADMPAAFEFRHESWLSEDVYDRLRDRNVALCVTDNEKLTTPLVATADYGYFRLRDQGYGEKEIAGWAEKISEEAAVWKRAFVYFKHEKEGMGPEFARSLIDNLSTA